MPIPIRIIEGAIYTKVYGKIWFPVGRIIMNQQSQVIIRQINEHIYRPLSEANGAIVNAVSRNFK